MCWAAAEGRITKEVLQNEFNFVEMREVKATEMMKNIKKTEGTGRND